MAPPARIPAPLRRQDISSRPTSISAPTAVPSTRSAADADEPPCPRTDRRSSTTTCLPSHRPQGQAAPQPGHHEEAHHRDRAHHQDGDEREQVPVERLALTGTRRSRGRLGEGRPVCPANVRPQPPARGPAHPREDRPPQTATGPVARERRDGSGNFSRRAASVPHVPPLPGRSEPRPAPVAVTSLLQRRVQCTGTGSRRSPTAPAVPVPSESRWLSGSRGR